MMLSRLRCRVGCTVLVQGFGAHKALCASSAGDYGWSDGLPHSLLSPSYSQLSLSLLCALSPSFSCCCWSVGKWMSLLFAASASHSVKLHHASGACVHSACMWIHRIGSGIYSVRVCSLRMRLWGCVWPGHLVLRMQAWSRLISCLQKLAIKSWSGCQFKWNEMEPESN